MEQIEAFILAGGASSRMGTDKSQLLIGEKTFNEHIAATLLEIVETVTVVGRSLADPRLKSVADVYPQWGALGGLHAALNACKSDWALVVACDLPFVGADLFRRLATLRGDHDAVVPVQPDQRVQPLCALYRTEPCLLQATGLIQAGKRRPLDLLQVVNTRLVPFAEIQDLDHAQQFFLNINTPEDYYEATRNEERI